MNDNKNVEKYLSLLDASTCSIGNAPLGGLSMWLKDSGTDFSQYRDVLYERYLFARKFSPQFIAKFLKKHKDIPEMSKAIQGPISDDPPQNKKYIRYYVIRKYMLAVNQADYSQPIERRGFGGIPEIDFTKTKPFCESPIILQPKADSRKIIWAHILADWKLHTEYQLYVSQQIFIHARTLAIKDAIQFFADLTIMWAKTCPIEAILHVSPNPDEDSLADASRLSYLALLYADWHENVGRMLHRDFDNQWYAMFPYLHDEWWSDVDNKPRMIF